ncbi:MAG: hypothetical protein ABR559_09185 [Gemmatimonadota bacterium]
MGGFVDHVQLLPMPYVAGRRQPDGAQRPGGLGMATLADRLAARGWTARIEDFSYDKPMSEARLVEAFARGLGDGVLSARDRQRFPIVLSRASVAAVGVADALGPDTGIVWVSPAADYRTPGWLRRPPVDRTALALVTGRASRDRMAVAPRQVPAAQVILVGGTASAPDEARAFAADGGRTVPPASLDQLTEAIAATSVRQWYLHLDVTALAAAAAPAADPLPDGDPTTADAGGEPAGLDPDALAAAIRAAFPPDALAAVTLARYDLNRDPAGVTAATLVALLEATLLAAGGVPSSTTDDVTAR